MATPIFRKKVENPIALLEKAIAECIADGIHEYYKFYRLEEDYNVFGHPCVSISENTIRIRVPDVVDQNLAKDFENIVGECFITKHLTFEKDIIFEDLKEEE